MQSKISQEKTYEILLTSTVARFGLELDTKSAAEALTMSTRQLDELRKKAESPRYIDARSNGNSKGIKYTAQAIVEYQLTRADRQVVTSY